MRTAELGYVDRAGTRRAPPPRLTARTVSVASLDRSVREQAFALFETAYEGADRTRFEHDFAEKQLVILLHDASNGQLKGFTTVFVREQQHAGRMSTVVFSGDTVIDKRYWGQKVMQREFAAVLMRLKLRAPHRPLYWFLISKGYRTYMLLANAFPSAVPRHDRPEDPVLRDILNRLATERFGSQYDVATGIVRYDSAHERVRDGIAPVTPDAMRNPHVEYYVARNPGHVHGHELACLARVRLIDLCLSMLRYVRTQLLQRVRA